MLRPTPSSCLTPRVADLVQAGKVRVALHAEDPVTGELRGWTIEMS